MIIHTVFFWLTDEAKADHVASFESALDKLATIDAIQSGNIGKPAATEERPVTDHSWDYAIHFHFANMADHDAYQVHPDHDVFIDDNKALWAKVHVRDTEVA